jgi:histidinol-phosphate/aromatic aminotransferase/cobyric acid decarboxylase-like protein
MPVAIDLGLFDRTAHSPSMLALRRAAGTGAAPIHDFCIPVNPYFPPPAMLAAIRARLVEALTYYPSSNEGIAAALAEALGLDPDTVVVGNGSTELLTWIDWLLVHGAIATPVPTFGRWTDHPREIGRRLVVWRLRAECGFALDVDRFVRRVRHHGCRAAAICNPNNPTGALVPQGDLVRLLDELSDLDVVVVDESFLDFADEGPPPSLAPTIARWHNAIVLKSLGKNFGLHGVRAGYAVAGPRLAARLRQALPHWNVNGLAEALIREFPAHAAAYEHSRRRVVADRRRLASDLRELRGLTVYPSWANFVYVRLPEQLDGEALRNELLTEHGLLVRSCGNKLGSDARHLRIAVRPPEESALLLDALRGILYESTPR